MFVMFCLYSITFTKVGDDILKPRPCNRATNLSDAMSHRASDLGGGGRYTRGAFI